MGLSSGQEDVRIPDMLYLYDGVMQASSLFTSYAGRAYFMDRKEEASKLRQLSKDMFELAEKYRRECE